VGVMQTGLVKGLKFIFSDFYIPMNICLQGIDSIHQYFYELNKNYDFEWDIPVGAINELVGILYNNDKIEEALELLKNGLEIHPTSATIHCSLAEIYVSSSNFEKAKKHLQKARDLSSSNIQENLKYKTLLLELNN
jgi:tetratricopeptide (TPR) repeat protein